jgi:hypothetical protein
MNSRTFFIAAVALSIASGAAFADGPLPGKSREQVNAELAAWRSNPVTADGYRFIGGEAGYVYEGASAAGRLGGDTSVASQSRERVRQDIERFRANPVTVDGYREVGGEVGFVYEGRAQARLPAGVSASGTGTGMPSGLTKAQVQRELRDFQRHPVSADGLWRYTGGEAGWQPILHSR